MQCDLLNMILSPVTPLFRCNLYHLQNIERSVICMPVPLGDSRVLFNQTIFYSATM